MKSPFLASFFFFFFFFFSFHFKEEGDKQQILEIMERGNGGKILKKENKKDSHRVMGKREREREFIEVYLRG